MHQGRSLSYRFAAAAPLWAGALTGHTPLTPGTTRRLASGALRYFLDREAVNADGLLSLGWHGQHLPLIQEYSGPASPYWASKGFLGLLLPPDHPVWTATEEPAPVERADAVLPLPRPGWLIQSSTADGIVRLHNHGSDHVRPHEGESAAQDDPLYGRQAYSTHTGPTSRTNVADNHLSVEVDGAASVRRRIHPLGAGQGDGWGWAASWHRPVFRSGPQMVPGLRVESVTVARGRHELRIHRVIGAPHGARVTLTGWATQALRSELTGVHGWDEADQVRAPEGTAYEPWVRMPRLSADVQGTAVLVALAALGADADTGTPPLAAAVAEVTWADGELRVRWADGPQTVVTFEPLRVRTV
jgi:hypothetical protein